MADTAYSGYRRDRRTPWRVRAGDRCARALITAGGFGTIAAVALVCVFLVWVVLPLLRGGEVHAPRVTTPAANATAAPLHAAIDPYQRLAWQLRADGRVHAFQTADGSALSALDVFAPASVAAIAAHADRVLLGGRDGSLTFCTIAFATDFLPSAEVPAHLAALPAGSIARTDQMLIERTPELQFRRQTLELRRDEPIALGAAAVHRCDFADTGSGVVIAAITTDGQLHVKRLSKRYHIAEDREITELRGGQIGLATLEAGLADMLPEHVRITAAGDAVLLVTRQGHALRIDARDLDAPVLVETVELVAPGRTVTALGWLLGSTTLLVGDSAGDVGAWFRTRPTGANGRDGAELVRARTFDGDGAGAVTTLGPSLRSRLFAVGHADGRVRVWHGTSERRVVEMLLPQPAALDQVGIAPKEDAVLALAGPAACLWPLQPGHPEVSPAAMFLPVWYEGYQGPEHVWQSTGGTDDFEPKFGLWPLIFGTLKATLYCLLFGVPLALLAAIYTAEFLRPRTRARVKPAIEMMASLPSVVLGFLAALVFAPVVEQWLATVLATLVAVPLALLLGAQVWQALPANLRPRAEHRRLLGVAIALPLGFWLAGTLGALGEAWLFDGDLKAWLAAGSRPSGDPARGSAFGGFFLLCGPLAAIGAAVLTGRLTIVQRLPLGGTGRLLAGVALTLVATTALAALATTLGLDLRGGLLGTYDQRNSLVVGVVMGFAVVPIIYTLAEDALSAVPEHLRAASLGAGATRWQTAVRIVLPTALSGIFSAIMVGLGRAVGETMIVLMAAGNTPVLELNPFNGFRTLSANIATELPEAVRDSTHYRMLYLAALCLFAMTFVLNSLAEVVRQRFRKRAYQL